jgi:hypothetical protein
LALWGYEQDPHVVDEVMAALRSARIGRRTDQPTAR